MPMITSEKRNAAKKKIHRPREKKGQQKTDLSDLVYKTRALLGMTQAEFAGELGVTVTTVSRWERGALVPSSDKLLRLALSQIQSTIKAA